MLPERGVFGAIVGMIVLARLRCFPAHRFVRVCALAGLFLLTGAAHADVEVWGSIGPAGGNVFALAMDPHTPATIYAGTGGGIHRFNSSGGGSVFKTTNGGASWQPAGSGLPADAVLFLAIDPVTTSTAYAGTRNHGAFKTTDGGTSWTAAGLTANRVWTLAIDPVTPSTLYAGTASGVFKSTDGAATWTTATSGIGAQQVFALAIDPVSPSTLYAGTRDNGVFRSSDGAASWTAATSGLTATRVFALAVDPKSPSTLYAGTNGDGVFKTTDGAATWAHVVLTGTFLFLAIDSVTPSTVYGGGVNVEKSVDGVATWQRVTTGIPVEAINALAVDPVTPSTLYVGTQSGVFKSTNGGVSATPANIGLAGLKILALAVDPTAPATIYAGTDIGLFKSADGGVTWISVTVSPYVTRILSLAVLPGSSTILAGMDDGGWRSTDGGATWTHLDNMGIPFAWTLDPGSPATVYAAGGFGASGPTQGGAWKSTDGGVTWTGYGDANAPLPVFESVVVPARGATAVVGTDAGVYGIFIHGGGRYEWVTNNALATRVVYALVMDPSSSSTMWAGTDGGLFRSADGGVSWAPVTNGLPAATITALKFDPASPKTFYAATTAGLFRSTDDGAMWTALNAGLTNLFVNAFAILPGSPETLFVGIFGGGVYRFPTPPVVADFSWPGSPVAGQPVGFTDLSTGLVTSWSWNFGDGGFSTAPYPTHTYAAPGSYQVSLTVTNAAGPSTKTQTITVTPAIAGATVTKVVPIVLDVTGVGGAHFSTELTLANRGTTSSKLQITYFAATALGASGSGTVTETLGPGRQVSFPDTIAYLRGKGLAIPTGSGQGGALFVTFEGLSSADVSFAGARTTAPSGNGRAGLAYSGVRLEDGFTAKAYVFGLRENTADRSNLALVNMNAAEPVTLRVTLVSGTDGKTSILPDVTLAGGQWTQIGHVLSLAGFVNGFAIVELISGPGPFYTYGVFNDNTTADGSFVPPTIVSGGGRSVLPVLVETGTFQSELVLSNPYNQPLVATMTYLESLTPSGGTGGVATETLGPYEQKIIPGAVDYLRGKGVSIGARGAAGYAGAVRITFTIGSGSIPYGFAGARTSAPANGGGQYGVSYRALLSWDPSEAWVFGLQQNSANRSNLAVVNAGNGADSVTYRLDVYDGDTGKLAGSSPVQTLPPGGWFQFSPVLPAYGVRNGYVRVVKLSGGSWILAYGVVNDGATPGSGATNDGSFVAFSNR